MLRTRDIIKISKMEKNIKIDSITVADIIRRINYNEEEILDMIEGLSEAASTLCYYTESHQSVKSIVDAQKILCELLRIEL